MKNKISAIFGILIIFGIVVYSILAYSNKINCSVTKCTIDKAFCVGDTATVAEGLYEGNIGIITDITYALDSTDMLIYLRLCDGTERINIYKDKTED